MKALSHIGTKPIIYNVEIYVHSLEGMPVNATREYRIRVDRNKREQFDTANYLVASDGSIQMENESVTFMVKMFPKGGPGCFAEKIIKFELWQVPRTKAAQANEKEMCVGAAEVDISKLPKAKTVDVKCANASGRVTLNVTFSYMNTEIVDDGVSTLSSASKHSVPQPKRAASIPGSAALATTPKKVIAPPADAEALAAARDRLAHILSMYGLLSPEQQDQYDAEKTFIKNLHKDRVTAAELDEANNVMDRIEADINEAERVAAGQQGAPSRSRSMDSSSVVAASTSPSPRRAKNKTTTTTKEPKQRKSSVMKTVDGESVALDDGGGSHFEVDAEEQELAEKMRRMNTRDSTFCCVVS